LRHLRLHECVEIIGAVADEATSELNEGGTFILASPFPREGDGTGELFGYLFFGEKGY
jgi:hypothetical protein